MVTEVEVEDGRGAIAAAQGEADAMATRLPVAFVVTQSDKRANGGVESITQILERFQRVRPLVVTQAETPFNRRWRAASARVLVWQMPALAFASLLKNNLRMFRLVRAEGCRVVHCNDIYALWHTAFGARMAGASVVFNVRNIKPADERYGWRWQLARRISTRQLVLSKEMREVFARRLGVKESRAVARRSHVEHIYSAVDPQQLSPVSDSRRAELREMLGVRADCFAIGLVAAFEPRKAQLDFIKRAVPRLKNLVPRMKVYFVGDFTPALNVYARRCLEAAQAAGLEESVSFVGYTPEVADWYRALDVCVVASRNEGLARCMIESLACGTPVVSFDVCSAREILAERGCGIVVAAGDYETLATQVASLAADNDARARLGERGVAAARELFDPAEVVRRYERLYLSLGEN
jgi:glycosyltransferase involved in cell wall biosynthesis